MQPKLNKIIVSEKSFNSDEPYDLVYSNVTVVNVLKEEKVGDAGIHEDGLTSYYVDYYLAQYNNGNFPQFVWNTGWNADLNRIIEKGLGQIGAEKHLQLFRTQSEKVEKLPEDELKAFLQSDYFGENPTRDSLKNYSFYDVDEDLIKLNSKWLRNHPQLEVMTIENMFLELEKFIGRKIDR